MGENLRGGAANGSGAGSGEDSGAREKVDEEVLEKGSGAGSKANKVPKGLDSEGTFSVALRAVGDFTCAYATEPPKI